MKLKDLKNGWMKIPSDWFNQPTTPIMRRSYDVLQWLIMNANMEDAEWNGVTVKRGQIITSVPKICAALCLTERQAKVSLNVLQTSGKTSDKTSNRYRVITICNYDDYVGINSADVRPNVRLNVGQTSDSVSGKRPTERRQNKDIEDIRIQEERRNTSPLSTSYFVPPQAEGESLENEIDFEISEPVNTETQKRKEKSSAKKEKINLDDYDIAPDMRPTVELWMAYKKERGEPYKPRGVSIFYKRLRELSGNSATKAKTIVEQSIANNYSGIFPIRESANNVAPSGIIRSIDYFIQPEKYEKF